MQVRATYKDETLPHQIVILRGSSGSKIDISCNCWRLTSNGGYRVMGTITTDNPEEAWKIYDSGDHNNYGERPAFVPGERPPTAWVTI